MHEALSEAGVLRREAMRAMLVGAVVHRRRRRRAVRVAVAALLAGAGIWFALPEQDRPREQPVVKGPSLIQVIANDTSVLARLSCGGPVTAVEFLDDLDLVAELRHNGRDAGLVRCRGRADVLPRIDDDWQAVQ